MATVVIVLSSIGRAAAQWHVGLELGTVEFRGATRDSTASPGPTLRPDHATTYAIRLGRAFGSWSAALRASLGTPGVAGVAPKVTFTDRTTGRLIEIAPLVGVRAAALGPEGVVRIEAGPAVDLWDINGEIRSRLAGLAAVAYEWHVTGRMLGALRAESTLGSSVFDSAELPSQLERRPTWRYGVTVGLRYRL
ncbi:MAG TPA: hypothetical protein VNH63_08240 [Gemmatimonadales bacterium]|nr:hypothetical protein [Gemmatimonadales bacterium]